MSVARAQAEISSAEFTEWLAHFTLKQEDQKGDVVQWNDLVKSGGDVGAVIRHV